MSKPVLSVELPAAGAIRLSSDERLVGKAADGDRRAFAAIYRRYRNDLYRFSLAIVGDAEDAEDALQATMVKALRALPGERREIKLKPWLYRIAHNESVELLRRRRAAEPLEPELPAPAPEPDEEVAQRTRLRNLLGDLEELPERQRGALVMRELSGLRLEEIGAALDASPAVARQALYEARLSLRQMEEGRRLACERVTMALSEADGRVARRRDLRAHLRHCPDCRRFGEAIGERRLGFAAIAPLPALVAAEIFKGAAGAKWAGGGLTGSLPGGFGGAFGSALVVKSTATVVVAATIGVSAAEREGFVDLGLRGGGERDAVAREVPAGPLLAPLPPRSEERAAPPTGGESLAGSEAGQPAGRAAGDPGAPASPAASEPDPPFRPGEAVVGPGSTGADRAGDRGADNSESGGKGPPEDPSSQGSPPAQPASQGNPPQQPGSQGSPPEKPAGPGELPPQAAGVQQVAGEKGAAARAAPPAAQASPGSP